MNRNEIAGQWKQLKGRAREKWGELTDDDLDKIDGRRERLVGVLQERYGKTEQEASKEADDFFDSLEKASTS
ncbi:CsbD family protein [Gaopeijia maritima]|uniref:CsbD family protein n=1 Tax=Gaopeijia maritima TaxID=3119007 RepID=A0ABU9EFW3_9BACT